MFYEVPSIAALAFRKEIEQYDIVELQTFGFIDGETECMLQYCRNLLLGLLVSDDDDLVTAKFQRWSLHHVSIVVLQLLAIHFLSAEH